jgi:ABC-type transport system substrate-binding protein
MNTETIQSADMILSWKMLMSSTDFSGSWANIVNVVPINNLTADFYLSAQSATFPTYSLETPILPYHLWVQHDWTTTATAAWNYTGGLNGYDTWNLGYNINTGMAPGLVGSGPFMFNGGYGQPAGVWLFENYWSMYANPHYFVQYINSTAYRQWTPKFFELYAPRYLSLSAAVAAEGLGQVDTVVAGIGGIPPTFLPTIKTMANTYIYNKPSTSYGYMQLNSFASNAPFNITAFRQALNYATDKAYLASVLDEGYSVLGQPIVPPSDPLWRNASTPSYSYNPTEAMSLIRNISGMSLVGGNWYYHGTAVTADIQTTTSAQTPLGTEGALIIAKEWSSIGVPTTVTQESFTTVVANLITYSYNTISLGITGIEGDVTGDFFDFYNQTVGYGTGFWLGPWSSLDYQGHNYTGAQINSLMNNLTNELNVQTNLQTRLGIAYEIQGIAADESTMINLGYPIDILPFTNTTFVNVTRSSLAYTGFMYWNFMSLHLRSTPIPTAPSTSTQLTVTVSSPKTVLFNTQYDNLSIGVRNQYGQAMPGMNVTVGYNPSGSIINVSSDNGVTNSAGVYTYEFRVFSANSLILTNDYGGEVKFTASAYAPTGSGANIVAGIGSTSISIAPNPVYYTTSAPPILRNGAPAQLFDITVYNALTNAPLAGYSYDVQALSGAVTMGTTSSVGQTLTQTTSVNPIYGIAYAGVEVTNQSDYNLTSITGVTPANGTIVVSLAANASVNFTAMGSTFESWVFLGNYAVGGAVGGEAPYSVIAELTTASNPSGFGLPQPVEIPVTVTDVAPPVDISLSTSSANTTYSGSISLTVTTTNSTTGLPVPNYQVELLSQNALGANRGVLSGAGAIPTQGYNPNEYFGSGYLFGVTVTTNATGVAVATFSPSIYTPQYVNGAFSGFSVSPYVDQYLVPFDEFQLSASSTAGETASTTAATVVNSSAFENNVAPSTVVYAYLGGASTAAGVSTIYAGANATVFVNSTESGIAGPFVSGIPVSVSVSSGNLSTASGTTTGGTFVTTYTPVAVSIVTPVTLIVVYTTVVGGKNVTHTDTQTFFVIPAVPAPTTPPPPVTTTTTPAMTTYIAYGLAVLFAVIALVLGALYIGARKRRGPPTEYTSTTTTSSTSSQASSTPPSGNPGGGGSGGSP